jgi:hypothetical protein
VSILSTTIGRGLESAKPGSPREGYLYFGSDTGLLQRYSGSVWQNIAPLAIDYEFDSSTTDGDPGVGGIRFNNATPGNVDEIYIDDNPRDVTSLDLSSVWQDIDGAYVLLLDENDTSKFLLIKITSSSNETPSYTKWVVTVEDSGSLPTAGDAIEILVFGGGSGGGGGAASVNWWDSPQAHVLAKASFYDGNALNYYGVIPGLTSGTADISGVTGAGGFTELEVGCSAFYDITPSNGQQRGLLFSDTNQRSDIGMYCRASVRFCTAGYSTLAMGMGDNVFWSSGAIVNHVAFQKLSGDTNFFATAGDGSTAATRVDTGVAWATGDWHNFEIYLYDNGGTQTAKYWIDGTLVATITTNCPLATELQLDFGIYQAWTNADTATEDSVFFCSEVFWAVQQSAKLSALGYAAL